MTSPEVTRTSVACEVKLYLALPFPSSSRLALPGLVASSSSVPLRARFGFGAATSRSPDPCSGTAGPQGRRPSAWQVPPATHGVPALGSSQACQLTPRERAARSPSSSFPSSPSGRAPSPVIGPTSVPVPSPPKACPKVPARTHEPLDRLPVNRPTPHPHGGPVGPRESVEHRFVIGTTLTPFWVRRRRVYRFRSGPTNYRVAARSPAQPRSPGQRPLGGTRCSPAATRRLSFRAAANKSDSLEPHRRSGRRRTWEHGVAGHHRPHRSAEIWLSSGPMASHQDVKIAGLGEAPSEDRDPVQLETRVGLRD